MAERGEDNMWNLPSQYSRPDWQLGYLPNFQEGNHNSPSFTIIIIIVIPHEKTPSQVGRKSQLGKPHFCEEQASKVTQRNVRLVAWDTRTRFFALPVSSGGFHSRVFSPMLSTVRDSEYESGMLLRIVVP